MARTSRHLAVLVGAVVATGLVAAPAASAGISPARALTIVNDWRAEAGVPAVTTMDPDLSAGCAAHNNYVRLNGLTHVEEPGRPGYTAEGAIAGRDSVLALTETTPLVWQEAVYHRASVLQPRLRTAGWDASNGATCMNIRGVDNSPGARSPALALHPWPANGARNVPLTFDGPETPDPYDEARGVPQLGYLLSVGVNGPWAHPSLPRSTVALAELTAADGTRVPLTIVDADNPGGAYLEGGFALFPHGALRRNTEYTAHVAGTVDAEGLAHPFDATWSFRTARRAAAPIAFAAPRAQRGGRVRFDFDAAQTHVGRRATLVITQRACRRCRSTRLVRRSLTLQQANFVVAPQPPRGGSVTAKVATKAFTTRGVRHPAASATRTYAR